MYLRVCLQRSSGFDEKAFCSEDIRRRFSASFSPPNVWRHNTVVCGPSWDRAASLPRLAHPVHLVYQPDMISFLSLVSSDIHVIRFFCLRNSGRRRYWKCSPRLKTDFLCLIGDLSLTGICFWLSLCSAAFISKVHPQTVQAQVTGIDDLGHWHHHLSSDY